MKEGRVIEVRKGEKEREKGKKVMNLLENFADCESS